MHPFHVSIIHGAYGYPGENWFPWLQAELEALKVPCSVPQFPTPQGQSLKAWLGHFNQVQAAIRNPRQILIGHSLGAAFLLRWLEQSSCLPHTVILVGAFTGSVGLPLFDDINQDFFDTPFSSSRLRERSRYFCYDGDNDPYVSPANFALIAQQLRAVKIIVPQGGHLNAAAGYTQFPQLLTHLKQIMEL